MTTRKKLRLDLDVLRVSTFDTVSGGEEARGTVRGHAEWTFTGCATIPIYMCSTKCVDPDTATADVRESSDCSNRCY